jgi:DNA (cytosine-5)-methyltransferase 1
VVIKMNMEKSFATLDLFAGIGGIRIGFEKAGFETVFANDFDKHCKTTYDANFNKPKLDCQDINKLDIKLLPKFDILLGGFPCQPFSNAGLKKGFEDRRGNLFFRIADIIGYHKPRVVFLENVKGFKNHDKGRTFSTVKLILEGMGYNVYTKVLNAKDFGVPQNRERIYIVGFLDKINFKFPNPLKKRVKVGNILDKHIDEKYTISDKLWAGHKRRKKEHKEKGNGFGYSIFDKDSRYTSTMSARYYKDGSEILIKQDGMNPRKLTPRESSRLQGFPENFKIPVSDTQAYKQFGNSVAVPVIREIAKAIKEELTSQDDENRENRNS